MSPADWTCFTYWRSSRNLPVFFVREGAQGYLMIFISHLHTTSSNTAKIDIGHVELLRPAPCPSHDHCNLGTWSTTTTTTQKLSIYSEFHIYQWKIKILKQNFKIWSLGSSKYIHTFMDRMTPSTKYPVRNPQCPPSSPLLGPPILLLHVLSQNVQGIFRRVKQDNLWHQE